MHLTASACDFSGNFLSSRALNGISKALGGRASGFHPRPAISEKCEIPVSAHKTVPERPLTCLIMKTSDGVTCDGRSFCLSN